MSDQEHDGRANPILEDGPEISAANNPAEVPGPVDRAQGKSQVGLPPNPDPTAPSGFRASMIAAVAYDTVQLYKHRAFDRPVAPEGWDHLSLKVQTQIIASVAKMISGESRGAATLHADWAENQRANGVTVEEDPRIDLAWGNLPPLEGRKALLFGQVAVALIRRL